MSLYGTHKCVFDFLRATENAEPDARPEIQTDGYDLTDEERRALKEKDIAALYTMGLHSVLLNTYCRTVGFSRNDYRKILEDLPRPEPRSARWQTS